MTLSDLAQRVRSAKTVMPANFLKDVNASDTLSLADKGQINTQLTKALFAPKLK